LLPRICGPNLHRWWAVWAASWPLLAGGAFLWAIGCGASWQQATATTAFLVALPGVWGPAAVRPVGVDLPAMAVAMCAAVAFVNGYPLLGAVLVLVAGCIKESAPIFVALWIWSPIALVGLLAPLVAGLVLRPELDPVTAHPTLREVHDHPFRSALEHRKGRWRDAWLWVAPWGVTLAALVGADVRTVVTMVVAHLQAIMATDTVRLVAWAGPVMAFAAAGLIPVGWLLLAVAVHVFWWRQPELV